MAAGDHQTDKGRLQIRIFDIIGGNVALDMVYAHQRQLFRVADGLGLRHAHQKGPHQARPVGDADGVQIIQRHARRIQGFLDHLVDFFDVLAGGDLRHHAAIELVQLDLGRDNIGKHAAPVLYHGSRRLVAGALYGQYIDILFCTVTHFLHPQISVPRISGPSRPSRGGKSAAPRP